MKEIQYRNPINQTLSKIKIFGLPLKNSSVSEAKRLLSNELMLIEELSNNESSKILQSTLVLRGA